jgi:hypothetical protein
VYALIYYPVMIIGVVAIFVTIGAVSRRTWVQVLVACTLLILSAGASVWVLQLGWILAILGILMLIAGVVWRLLDRSSSSTSGPQQKQAHASGGLLWPGLALLAAPFTNVYLLMPILRQLIH